MKIVFRVLFFLCIVNIAFAQKEYNISFNEKINIGKVDNTTSFYISNDLKKYHLKGNKINDFQFEKPGKYLIKVIEKNTNKEISCEHNYLPTEIIVNVSRTKMIFDGKKLFFSNPIIQNVDTNGIKLSIPVTIQTYDHQPASLNFTPVNSAGIGSSIIAKLDENIKELPEGIHILNYSLSGKVTQKAYLMFDFVAANGTIQSVSVLTPVNDK